MNISNILGIRFNSKEEAAEFLSLEQVIVTENNETFFTVLKEHAESILYSLDYAVT
ncbi:hypothetical protein PQ478_09245 [Alkalihalophilus pseudofirmus]|uniref:hypothetical protein n=1 Tax=Alkalihalophilus pseudofirmus TaxID=79885 RepID=UPI00259B6041|nr:hypothetical protein [Alkalihalophilus pseudofirmus]WEG18654.1 hypothetical protein PQ478_09245 [Alkalihalophilus pseudofirmus]